MTTVNNATSAALATANATTQGLASDTENRFLTLLVTQLQNQDPLNPMDNAEVTSQMAQLSMVTGITQLNNTLLALSGQMDVSQSMQAASLIGKDVLVPGTKIAVGVDEEGTHVTPFGVDMITEATKVVVTVTDTAGNVVRSIDLGSQPVGVISVDWDGKNDAGTAVAAGAYTFNVKATNASEQAVSADALTYGRVGSVAYTSAGLTMDLGLAGSHSLLSLRKIM